MTRQHRISGDEADANARLAAAAPELLKSCKELCAILDHLSGWRDVYRDARTKAYQTILDAEGRR